ncbi:structural cement protein Gp24 [Lactiplantibacillus mudanjiangensis]|uniref:Uncharacterized protein n=1 Tax=Lactiplantibacillus mudanjiangensis TaxID=1296538 RepID=A0A660E6A8_9LACO|nr:hypothetical protein [Lactiplantibacillus mudanjiangensis]VDG23673.1 hypothetical protein [Lactobacillus parabuchneri] [Lactiplantibacillus mudanjiangensis]VDG27816.1 hypothetical protein [Lactobacillus parabuchneri] [Lactiplantibacillus mudanjiangensis]
MPMEMGDGWVHAGAGAGHLADTRGARINSDFNAGTVLGLGQAVKLGDDGLLAVAADSTDVYGVTAFKSATQGWTLSAPHDVSWDANDIVSVVRQGQVYVPVNTDVAKGQKAIVDADGYFKSAAGVEQSSGDGSATTTTDTTFVGYFRTDAKAGETAALELNLR